MEVASVNTEVMDILKGITDPEIPVLSIFDIGIVKRIAQTEKQVAIDITPTYTGCPAMDTIAADIKLALEKAGYQAMVELILSPAWSTDDISEAGREKLKAYGIAAPLSAEADKRALLDGEKLVECPRCKTTNTKMISQFGSTACKSLFQCNECLEPFDYFKCLT